MGTHARDSGIWRTCASALLHAQIKHDSTVSSFKKKLFFFFPLEISSLEQLVFTTDPKSTIEHDLVTTMSVKANIQNNGFWY